MERSREARRGSMAALNGGLSRRRQRTGGLRDSPEADGGMEMAETTRLRERAARKERDRDCERDRERERSGRSKRRRGERMMLHDSNRDEGDDTSDDSIDEEDDEEDTVSVTTAEIRHLCSYLQDPKKAYAEEMRRSVYANYSAFIRT